MGVQWGLMLPHDVHGDSVSVLLAIADPRVRALAEELLAEGDFDVRERSRADELLDAVRLFGSEVVVLDEDLRADGVGELVEHLRRVFPETLVLLLARGDRGAAEIRAASLGAAGCLVKTEMATRLPAAIHDLVGRRRADDRQALFDRLADLDIEPEAALRSLPLKMILGQSASVEALCDSVSAVAPLPTRVLITGETGTGKELLARLIHYRSDRHRKPFVPINCAAIPEALVESELFGHVRGAFTGAAQAQEGLFAVADGGTLLLDEVGELPLAVQAKLLRILEDGMVRPVGGKQWRHYDVRILAATNRDLDKDVEAGTFRRDLYYRLQVVRLHVPPLRERLDDLPHLAYLFLRRFSRRFGKPLDRIEPAVLEKFSRYTWPGNVRELEHVMEKAVVFAQPPAIRARDIGFFGELLRRAPRRTRITDLPFFEARANFERRYLSALLRRTRGNLSAAARIARMGRTTLREKAQKLGLMDRDWGNEGETEQDA